ncbi:MAG: hypothetical protein KAS32_22480 [Candidatus Peribacteraceae bacterium]|nr:hypothetical protein [Candidatus Peribacteraceae bacterium]
MKKKITTESKIKDIIPSGYDVDCIKEEHYKNIDRVIITLKKIYDADRLKISKKANY